jgi:outer membrane immunogenic protein
MIMKTSIIFLAVAILSMHYSGFSQSPLPKGETQINAGVGFSERGIPIYFGFDHGIHNNVSLGGEFSYRGYKDTWRGNSYKHNIAGIAMNGNYHFNQVLNIPSNWDFYAGLNLGFFIWGSDKAYDGPYSSGLGLGAQIGGRYYFSPKTGINLEFGGGNAFSGGKFGLTFRL